MKIRGYRIELTEIESVLLGVPGVAQAVVDVWEPAEGVRELVAWYSTRGTVSRDDLLARLRDRLPAYMVPAYLRPGRRDHRARRGAAACGRRRRSCVRGLCLGPILLKWVLVGRWKETELPLWGWRYFRFWLVRTAIRANPLMLFTGTPVVTLYLRALGARIGPRTLWLSRTAPTCTDLVAIGSDTVVRKDAFLTGHRAEGGRIRTGRVVLGDRAFVGGGSVLDVGTAMGDHTQLAHASSLHTGQEVPAGEAWHGTPAEPAGPDADFRRAEPTRVPSWRRAVYGTLQVLQVLVIVLPVALGALEALAAERVGGTAAPTTVGSFLRDVLVLGSVAFGTLVLLQLVLATVLPRLLQRMITPGRTYALFGLRYSLLRLVTRLSNRPFLDALFGDSSAITRYSGCWATTSAGCSRRAPTSAPRRSTRRRSRCPSAAAR